MINKENIKELLGDVVLVEQLEAKVTSGGILLPPTADPLKVGIQAGVLMVGSKFQHKDDIKIGDIVIVSKYLGTALNKNNELIRIYDGEDILGVVER